MDLALDKIRIKFVSTSSNNVRELISSLDKLQSSLYPEESNHLMTHEELEAPNCKLLGAFQGEELVGVGGCLFFDGYAELKRFYVVPEKRGLGVARLISEEVEKLIRLADLPLARLEIGVRQPKAISFYKGLGFKERGAFGAYKEDPLSIFMEKIIL